MKVPDTEGVGGVMAIQTSNAVYMACYTLGKVAVRLLSDPAGLAGSWADREPITSDWRETAQLMVGEWEESCKIVAVLKGKNRNTVWVHALQKGLLILDYYLEGYWFCTVFQPKEVC